jgi:DNA-binding transcriptional MerR regulator
MPFELDGQTFYNTGEACRLAGANRDTFLRWVRQSKFTDVEYRDRNGWRLFTDDDIQRLKARVKHVERVGTAK